MTKRITDKKGSSEHERALHWVAKAADLGGDQFWKAGVMFVRSGDSPYVTAAATDGRRLHLAQLGIGWVMEQGFTVFDENDVENWKPNRIVKRTKTATDFDGMVDRQYVDFRKVIPTDGNVLELPVYSNEFGTYPELFLGRLLPFLQDSGYLVPAFRPSYIEQAAEIVPETVRVAPRDNTPENRAFLFSCPSSPFGFRAVVMPMRRGQ